jgi:hypothetical protein
MQFEIRDVKEEKFKFLLILSVDVDFSYSVSFLMENITLQGVGFLKF